MWPFKQEHTLRHNDICVHLISRFGRVKEAVVHQVRSDGGERVIAYPITPDQYEEVMHADNWLQAAAIVRKPDN